ncbi:GNAT family N-acetyltransferase [Undibacterium sp. Tian12W]|uniref:GNAT family N-acetyltransferase n=1 Tax=Undibacterium sp. Tian12W TaxID=3413054 RepID=UPI003BF40E67
MKRREFKLLQSQADIEAGFELMRQLRPQLGDLDSFTQQIDRQSQQGYRLSGLWQDEKLAGLIGFRESENMLYGRHLYVDDLVVAVSLRNSGLGADLLNKVRDEAKRLDCTFIVLDTSLQKPMAQRFYYREGLLATGMRFVQKLGTT